MACHVSGACLCGWAHWLRRIIGGVEWPLYWLAVSAIGIICNQQWTKGDKK